LHHQLQLVHGLVPLRLAYWRLGQWRPRALGHAATEVAAGRAKRRQQLQRLQARVPTRPRERCKKKSRACRGSCALHNKH
jgi:hypothetical protein